MMKLGWKMNAAVAVLMCSSLLVGGQAHAATYSHHHSHHKHQALGHAQWSNSNGSGTDSLQSSTSTPDTQTQAGNDTAASQGSNAGEQVIKAGEKYMGTPYQYGSSRSDKSTMDCSEFVMWAFKEGAGIDLGRGGARSEYKKVTPISRNDLQVGDLVFFSTRATMKYSPGSINRIGHVGIYAGNNKVLHTYGKGGVTYSNMSSGWWDTHFVAAGRVLK
ncbi:C40 family peptidase [Brevibacillus fluminis]|nr:C40 family peptidase [Brevibacillus fluminis]